MPLTGSDSVLSASLRAALIANPLVGVIDDTLLPASEKRLTAFCDVLAAVVIAHLLASGAGAVVTACPAGVGSGALT